jgi:molecular chaperone GrpE
MSVMVGKDKQEDDNSSDAGYSPEELEQLVQEKDAEIASLKEDLLRKRAEFDNFRKRTRKEQEEFRNFAVENLMMELLDVYDNFERAIESAHNTNDVDSVVEGVEMVFRQFVSILEKEGLKRIECEGEEFDPSEHEAMMHVEHADHPDNTIIDVCKPGYKLNSRIIRPAMVTVSKNTSSDKEEKSSDKEEKCSDKEEK